MNHKKKQIEPVHQPQFEPQYFSFFQPLPVEQGPIPSSDEIEKLFLSQTLETPEKLLEKQLKALLLGHQEPQVKQGKKEKIPLKKEKVFAFGTGRDTLPEHLKTGSIEIQKEIASSFGKKVATLYKSLLPTPQEVNRKKLFFDKLTKTIQKKWPEAKLYLFGSSANLLSIKGKGDMDVCIVFDKIPVRLKKKKKDQEEEEEESLEDIHKELNSMSKEEIELIRQRRGCIRQIGSHLERHYMKDVVPLLTARIPILKFFDPESEMNCDICINNTLAVKNTELIGDYCKIDSRVVEMIYFIKYWAKQRNLNQPYQGTLSSYAHVLMVIHYLQHLKEPLLPNLQLNFDGTNWSKEPFVTKNKRNVGYLIMGFFSYFAYEFDFEKFVISIKKETLTKEDLKWNDPEVQRNYICIQDPFEVDFNVGRSVPEENVKMIKTEFVRAFMMIQYKKDVKDVCADFKE